MSAFLMFILIMSFTPGPNTIMAMVSGQQKGITRSLALNFGMLCGFAIIGGVLMFGTTWLANAPAVMTGLKVIGSAYLLYLSYHVFVSRPESAASAVGGFTTGLLLQVTNVKVYLYFITGLTAFHLNGILANPWSKWLFMVLIGSVGTVTWTIAGSLINAFYQKHFRLVNTIVALLLIYATVDLWL
ncbi:MAG: LysE family transporter [Lacticaseibacillus songhuajiangensis]|nr:LysE family transporter [Lacticaseibacillus songhuajiangensis]